MTATSDKTLEAQYPLLGAHWARKGLLLMSPEDVRAVEQEFADIILEM